MENTNPLLPFKTLPNGNLLFPSWDEAIFYIDKYVRTNFYARRHESGETEVTIWSTQPQS